MKRGLFFYALSGALLLALALAPPAAAVIYDWNQPGGGAWDVPAHWLPSTGFPGAGDDARLLIAGSAITLNNAAQTANLLLLGNALGNYAISGGGSGGSLTVGAGGLSHMGAGSNEISARLIAGAAAPWAVSAGTLRLSNTALSPNGNDLTGATIAIGGGATLGSRFAGTGNYSGGTSSIANAAIVLDGGTLDLRGVLTPGGLTAQFFAGANHTGSIDGALTGANPDFVSLGRVNARQYTLPAATLGAPNSGETASLGARATVPGQAGYDGGDGAGNAYPGFWYDNSNGGSSAPFAGEGFSTADNLSVRFTGKVEITTGGDYTFATRSDDASALFIDGVRIVHNNNFQGMTTRSGTVTLAPGLHEIMVVMCENGGGAGLNAYYSGPDTVNEGAGSGVLVPIPANVL